MPYNKIVITIVECNTYVGNTTRSLPWYCYSCCALVTILGNELVIFPGVAFYYGNNYIVAIMYLLFSVFIIPIYPCYTHVGMEEARETTEEESSVVVQHTVICNYGNVRYKLATALNGVSGYDLTDDFKYAVKLLPSSYSAEEYTEFLDDWGTVSYCNSCII